MCVCAVSYLIFSVKLISRDYDHVNLEKLTPLFFFNHVFILQYIFGSCLTEKDVILLC